MIAEVAMADVLVWCALAFLLGMIYCVVAPLVYALVSAVLFCRRYYRENPDAQWPTDHRLVRISMWRVR